MYGISNQMLIACRIRLKKIVLTKVIYIFLNSKLIENPLCAQPAPLHKACASYSSTRPIILPVSGRGVFSFSFPFTMVVSGGWPASTQAVYQQLATA